MKRPVVVIHSDDWGRCGVPDIHALQRLASGGYGVGKSVWDYYGLETREDLQLLKKTLEDVKGSDGYPACITANFIMANADLRRMAGEGFNEFHDVPISDGFPEPWDDMQLVDEYKKLIDANVFVPGLHGYTHFSPYGLLEGWHDQGNLGRRVRALVKEDIPYMASLTPEYNFALLKRSGGKEQFMSLERQKQWIGRGIDLFLKAYGFHPVTTCAPGYRANTDSYDLFRQFGIKVVQTASAGIPHYYKDLLVIPRNVFFEPAMKGAEQEIEAAFKQAVRAARKNRVIVICTHSINYIQRHCGKRDQSLAALRELLRRLKQKFPDLIFGNDTTLLKAWSSRKQFRLIHRLKYSN